MTKLRSGLSNDRRRYKTCCKSPLLIKSGQGSIYSGDLEQVTIPGLLVERGYDTIANTLDDGDVPIPMSNIVFRS